MNTINLISFVYKCIW